MKQFEGIINGKSYTNYDEFNKALSLLEDTDNINVSYKYVSVPETNDEHKINEGKINIECDKNYVSESQYVKTITNKKDVELEDALVEKLKSATNKSDIKNIVYKKIMDFDCRIEDNLLHINELKSDYKKLEEKIKLINNQIKTLDDANNNYYLNKEYYTNIKNLIDTHTPTNNTETKKECSCDCKCEECKCEEDDKILSLNEMCDIAESELEKYLNKNNIHSITDLVEYFLKNY